MTAVAALLLSPQATASRRGLNTNEPMSPEVTSPGDSPSMAMPDDIGPAPGPAIGPAVGPVQGPYGGPVVGEASTVEECVALATREGTAALPCGCPTLPCCDDGTCVAGAKCVTFTEDWFPWGLLAGDAFCVAEPSAGQECGTLGAPCCFNDEAATPLAGGCTEDTPERAAACNFQLIGGPLCEAGPRKLSDAPGCGAEEFGVCCADETCEGPLVCRDRYSLVSPYDPFWTYGDGAEELTCFDCEVRPGQPCGDSAGGAPCCGYISVYKGYAGNLECLPGVTGESTCVACGQEGEPCCTTLDDLSTLVDGCDPRSCSQPGVDGVCNDGICGCPA